MPPRRRTLHSLTRRPDASIKPPEPPAGPQRADTVPSNTVVWFAQVVTRPPLPACRASVRIALAAVTVTDCASTPAGWWPWTSLPRRTERPPSAPEASSMAPDSATSRADRSIAPPAEPDADLVPRVNWIPGSPITVLVRSSTPLGASISSTAGADRSFAWSVGGAGRATQMDRGFRGRPLLTFRSLSALSSETSAVRSSPFRKAVPADRWA
jgi:hypothetical protein